MTRDVSEMQLRDVQRLTLAPGETLAVTVPRGTASDSALSAIDALKEWFPENHVILLEEGSRLEVIRPTREEASTGQDRTAEEA